MEEGFNSKDFTWVGLKLRLSSHFFIKKKKCFVNIDFLLVFDKKNVGVDFFFLNRFPESTNGHSKQNIY